MAEKIATREAYGKALAALADKYPDLVCFDADLAGATMTKFFKAACRSVSLIWASPRPIWSALPPV